MRILYLITKADRGGAQLNVLTLARSARLAGHEVTVVAGDGGWLIDRAAAEGIDTKVMRGLKRSWNPATVPLFVNELRAELARIRPDMLHMHSSNALFGVLAAASLGASRPSTVATVHGLSVLHPGWAGNPAKRLAYSQAVRRLWSGCDKVIFVCRSDRDFAVQRGLIDAQRTAVIRNGLAEPYDFLDEREARFRLGVPTCKSGLPVVGTVARLSTEKDLDLFLEAARLMVHGKCAFRIVGQGPCEFRIVRAIHDRGLDGRIAVVHSRGDAHRIMKGFDVFLMTSRYEGLPYTLLEAAYAGVPVVSVATGGIPELVVDGETGILVRNRNAADLADAVSGLLADREYADRLASAARAYVRTRFTDELMAGSVLETYSRIKSNAVA